MAVRESESVVDLPFQPETPRVEQGGADLVDVQRGYKSRRLYRLECGVGWQNVHYLFDWDSHQGNIWATYFWSSLPSRSLQLSNSSLPSSIFLPSSSFFTLDLAGIVASNEAQMNRKVHG